MKTENMEGEKSKFRNEFIFEIKELAKLSRIGFNEEPLSRLAHFSRYWADFISAK